MDIFSIQDLLPEIIVGHHLQGLDALGGVLGAIWTHESKCDFPTSITRQELLRMQPLQLILGGIPLLANWLAVPGGYRFEVRGKVDVY